MTSSIEGGSRISHASNASDVSFGRQNFARARGWRVCSCSFVQLGRLITFSHKGIESWMEITRFVTKLALGWVRMLSQTSANQTCCVNLKSGCSVGSTAVLEEEMNYSVRRQLVNISRFLNPDHNSLSTATASRAPTHRIFRGFIISYFCSRLHDHNKYL
jgi:hypothetical protein